jgi:hypothetical protein
MAVDAPPVAGVRSLHDQAKVSFREVPFHVDVDRMMRGLSRLCATLSILLGALALAGSAATQPRPAEGARAVVEFFTSQGCSSCPPADATVGKLARRPGIVALSLPVDYWDYLGWKDTLAQASFSARQRGYAHGRGDRKVYTPQAIVNGERALVGSDLPEIERALEEDALPLRVTVAERGADAVITVEGSAPRSSADLFVLPVFKSRTVEIERGENRGRTITYVNVVHAITRIGEWTGAPMQIEVPLAEAREGADGFVVLVQAMRGRKPGVILGAAKSAGL